jgi:hypothetical protein
MTSWAATALQSVTRRDGRLRNRRFRMVDRWIAQPTARIPAASGSWGATTAASRVRASPSGTPEAMRAAPQHATLARIAAPSPVLGMQDITDRDCPRPPATSGRGARAHPQH